MKTRLLLAIEGGGTKTRVLLADESGVVLERRVGGPASGLYVRTGEGEKALRTLLEPVRDRVRALNGRVVRAGMGGPMDAGMTRQVVRQVFGRVPVMLAGERQIALAVYGLRWGVALIAGTGASCTAVNEDGQTASCGGCGPQFGDEGSGYWIGRQAIASAMRMDDGRLQPSALVGRLCAFYGISRVWDILQFVERGSGHVSGPKVAACVPVVFDLARENDVASRNICSEAAQHLARLVAATAAQVQWRGANIPLVMAGGIFNGGGLITTPFHAIIRRAPFRFKSYTPVCEPADGLLNILRASS
ncbi:MAG: hypothetical protein NTU83_03215 [Candidatus Hydrogenedentes bacterium]|nr:hypothetical protein [Candidatus Hydrogenedentota bacterium]